MGIGPILGINSLSPFILSWFDFMMFSPLGEGGGGGGTQPIFIRGDSAMRSNPLPFYTPFFTKKVPLSYTFY